MGKINGKFDFEKTLKTGPYDSFLNVQSFLHITSAQITKMLYYTRVTPHQVILLSLLFGIAASILIVQDSFALVIAGSVLLFYKNVLDKVDGSLARARGIDSRRGRFYDSLSDFIVNVFVFSAMGYFLYQKYMTWFAYVICYSAMICSMVQCSFFIFYQVSFIKTTGKKTVNRLIETVTEEDLAAEDKWTLFMHRVFQFIYGWQDIFVYKLDIFMKKRFGVLQSEHGQYWYKQKKFLTAASILSIGTHMVFIALFAALRWFEAYLFINLILMNLLLICLIIFKMNSARTIINK